MSEKKQPLTLNGHLQKWNAKCHEVLEPNDSKRLNGTWELWSCLSLSGRIFFLVDRKKEFILFPRELNSQAACHRLFRVIIKKLKKVKTLPAELVEEVGDVYTFGNAADVLEVLDAVPEN